MNAARQRALCREPRESPLRKPRNRVILEYNIIRGSHMLIAKLRTVGGSVMFAIPKAIMDSLHLSPNTPVGLSVSKGKLIIDPIPGPRYTLSELLGQCDPDAPATADDDAWLNDHPAGREVI